MRPGVPAPTPASLSERVTIPCHQAPVYSVLKIAILKEALPPPHTESCAGAHPPGGRGGGHSRTRVPTACSRPWVPVGLSRPRSWPSVGAGAWPHLLLGALRGHKMLPRWLCSRAAAGRAPGTPQQGPQAERGQLAPSPAPCRGRDKDSPSCAWRATAPPREGPRTRDPGPAAGFSLSPTFPLV